MKEGKEREKKKERKREKEKRRRKQKENKIPKGISIWRVLFVDAYMFLLCRTLLLSLLVYQIGLLDYWCRCLVLCQLKTSLLTRLLVCSALKWL